MDLVKSRTSRRSNRSIQQEAITLFLTAFDPTTARLGSTFNYSSLVSGLLAIEGVSKIRTVRSDTNESFDGLSFFLWNPVYPELDKQSVVNNIQMKDFELFYLDGISTINSRIFVSEE